MMTRSRVSNLFVVAVFTVGIGLPATQQMFDLLPRLEVVDNRVLAPFPPLSTDPGAIRQLPDRFESWYADHMGMRGALVTGYRFLTDAVLGSPDVEEPDIVVHEMVERNLLHRMFDGGWWLVIGGSGFEWVRRQGAT